MQLIRSQFLAMATLPLTACSLVSVQIPIVTIFPVTTQTSLPSPQCTQSTATESFTVNYNVHHPPFLFIITTDKSPVRICRARRPSYCHKEIAEYNLLNFKSINFVDTDPDFDGNLLGTAAHTHSYVATFPPLASIVDNLLAPRVPMITANYIESTLTSFTPKSFWYERVFSFPYTAGSFPQDCNIATTGFPSNNKLVVTQASEFKANESVIQDQNFETFEGFDGVSSVAFGVEPWGRLP